MNKARRSQIDELIEKLEAHAMEINDLETDEQDAFDNLPEGFQDGDRGEAMQSAIDALAEAGSSIDEAVEYLKEARGE